MCGCLPISAELQKKWLAIWRPMSMTIHWAANAKKNNNGLGNTGKPGICLKSKDFETGPERIQSCPESSLEPLNPRWRSTHLNIVSQLYCDCFPKQTNNQYQGIQTPPNSKKKQVVVSTLQLFFGFMFCYVPSFGKPLGLDGIRPHIAPGRFGICLALLGTTSTFKSRSCGTHEYSVSVYMYLFVCICLCISTLYT